MGLGTRGERCHLFMADMDPFNLFASANRIRNSVERISADAVNSLHSCFHQNIYKQVSHSLSHIYSLLDNLDESTTLRFELGHSIDALASQCASNFPIT